MNYRYFFSAELSFNGKKDTIQGIINSKFKVKTIENLNTAESVICEKYNLNDEQRKNLVFISFNKL